MDTLRNPIVAILASVLLAVAAVAAFGLGGKVVTVERVGALSSPDIMSRYLAWGGVPIYSHRTTSLNQATTTVCAIQNPAAATSTLILGSIQFSVSSTTGSVVTIAKAANAFATTTSLGSYALAANAQGTVVSTSTPAAMNNLVFGPSDWLVVGMSGGGTFTPTGTCQGTWIVNG